MLNTHEGNPLNEPSTKFVGHVKPVKHVLMKSIKRLSQKPVKPIKHVRGKWVNGSATWLAEPIKYVKQGLVKSVKRLSRSVVKCIKQEREICVKWVSWDMLNMLNMHSWNALNRDWTLQKTFKSILSSGDKELTWGTRRENRLEHWEWLHLWKQWVNCKEERANQTHKTNGFISWISWISWMGLPQSHPYKDISVQPSHGVKISHLALFFPPWAL